MKERTFKRGIHIPEHKVTSSKNIVDVQPEIGEELIYPMLQHIGAPCEPVVNIGDNVLVGQKIADCSAHVSAPIHSSISGFVKAFKPALTPSGVTVNSIVIENDGLMKEHEKLNKIPDTSNYSKEDFLKIIREAGIVGLGGAGFPTHVKLGTPAGKKIDYIIVNAAECEPYLTTDHRVIFEEGERLARGMRVLLRMFPSAEVLFAIETNKSDAMKNIMKICENDSRITVVPLTPKYPQGSEKQLIYSCTGREVPSGSLPLDVACIVNNVDTVIAIDRAVNRCRPLMRKIITVSGGAVKNPGNFKVRLGVTFENLINSIGGFLSEPYKMVAGGPMMGNAMFTAKVPVIKTSSGFLCFTEKESSSFEQHDCIRCGRCVSYCPMNLIPLELNQNSINLEYDLFCENNGMDCVECGVCSYICPSKRHLLQSIRTTRRHLMARKK